MEIIFDFILHWFYLRRVTDQNIAFLVPDSCGTTIRNGDMVKDAIEND
jgi:hypothetical protein